MYLEEERQDCSNSKLHSPFLLYAYCTYFIPSETEAKVILEELAVKQFGVGPFLCACFIENVRQKAVEAVISAST